MQHCSKNTRSRELSCWRTNLLASQQYDGLQWRVYDTHFRVSVAATGNKSWSKLDTDLYTHFFTGRAKLVSTFSSCDSTQHTHLHCPKPGCKRELGKLPADSASAAWGKKRSQWHPDVCAQFNSLGSCSFGLKCKYKHVCGKCAGGHSAKTCSFKPRAIAPEQ